MQYDLRLSKKRKLRDTVLRDGRHSQSGKFWALRDVDFRVEAGESVAVIGPNGAGKSTTLKMIAGVLMPDAGKITINNQLVQMDSIASKKLIGYLPESNPLYKDLYVKEYLQFLKFHRLLPPLVFEPDLDYCWPYPD